MSDDIDVIVHRCDNCGNVKFYMVIGGEIVCCACGMSISAYWINEDGVKSEDINYAN